MDDAASFPWRGLVSPPAALLGVFALVALADALGVNPHGVGSVFLFGTLITELVILVICCLRLPRALSLLFHQPQARNFRNAVAVAASILAVAAVGLQLLLPFLLASLGKAPWP